MLFNLKVIEWQFLDREARLEKCAKHDYQIPNEYLVNPSNGKIHPKWIEAIQSEKLKDCMLSRALVETLAQSNDQTWLATPLAQIVLISMKELEEPHFRASYMYFDFAHGFLW